ncbi:MAG TPA: effector-associated domain EAD1-containing protein [Pyrinomonadaceae bacterium]|nr:effector-associated domain EAD1-containing protein [Pyrinomonadaceae bacterium]
MVTPAKQLELSPEVRRQLHGAFLNAFDQWKKLDQMLLFQMGLRLAALVGDGGMSDVIFELLFNVMEAQGKLPMLVKAACRHVPADQRLWGIATQLGWAPDAADTPGEAAASVRTGLRVLAELLRDPEVNSGLQAFRVVFEGADRKIHMVGDYKDLHDRLHELQLRCYSPILSARRDFPQGETSAQLTLDSRTLNTLIRQLRAIVLRPTLDANDFLWIEDNLETARLALNEAVAELSSAKLETAIGRLAEVMQLQPTLINSLLLRSVRDLDLPTLHSRLQQVSINLQALGAEDNQLAWFNKGVTQLNVLDAELKGQMSNHRAWQAVDNNFRLVEAALSRQIDELEASWKILQMKITVVCKDVSDDWAEEITAVGDLLDQAIRERKYSAIFLFFTKLQTLASDRFYNVDKEMKQLCEKLRPIGRELDAVLQVME